MGTQSHRIVQCLSRRRTASPSTATSSRRVLWSPRKIATRPSTTTLSSRGYVTEKFSWQWYYWYLTNEGIEYLREYLHLPAEIMPATLKKTSRPAARGIARDERGGGKGGFDGGKG